MSSTNLALGVVLCRRRVRAGCGFVVAGGRLRWRWAAGALVAAGAGAVAFAPFIMVLAGAGAAGELADVLPAGVYAAR